MIMNSTISMIIMIVVIMSIVMNIMFMCITVILLTMLIIHTVTNSNIVINSSPDLREARAAPTLTPGPPSLL